MMYSLWFSSLAAAGAPDDDDATGSLDGESDALNVVPFGTEMGSLLQMMLPTAKSW